MPIRHHGLDFSAPPPPGLLDRCDGGELLIVAGAACVWDDLARVRNTGDVMAVNDIGAYYPGVLAHWVTIHTEFLPFWWGLRRGHLLGNDDRPMLHSIAPFQREDILNEAVLVHWPIAYGGGTSGMLAACIGVLMGYTQITLAGMPMDMSPRFFEPAGADGNYWDRATQIVWQEAAERIFQGRVKSLSGNTRRLLGAPACEAGPPGSFDPSRMSAVDRREQEGG